MEPAGTNTVSFEKLLDRDGYLVYTGVGASMLPLLRQGKDVVIIRKKGAERCRKYDVVLYRRRGKYVLHRIVKVRENDYVILGDNCIRREYGVTDDMILGVLTGIVRNGKRIPVTDPAYGCYVRIWCALYPVRAAVRYCLSLTKSVISKVYGRIMRK